jgi:hypothetical protein
MRGWYALIKTIQAATIVNATILQMENKIKNQAYS